MSPRIERETTFIKKDGSAEIRRELITDLPDVSGIYPTPVGVIEIMIGGRRLDGAQKIVFKGEGMRMLSGHNRVAVKFPTSHRKYYYREIAQDISPTQRFIFSRSRRRFD